MSPSSRWHRLLLALVLLSPPAGAATNSFTVAFYNLENWLSMPRDGGSNAPKPELARTAAAAVIAHVQPDVLGVAEIGDRSDLADLQQRLRAQHLDYPHLEWLPAADSTRRLALLSRFPISQRQSITNASYELGRQRWPVLRGILDVRIHPTPDYSFRTLMVHLKSRRPIDEADQAAMRLGEARLLRRHLESVLAKTDDENLLVMGDFNDLPESPTLDTIRGVMPPLLVVLHPRDNRGFDTTYFWRGKRQWSRIDYMLLSAGLANEYLTNSAQIAAPQNTLIASDHRAIHARFIADDTPRTPIAPTPTPPATPSARTWVLLAVVLLLLVLILTQRRQRPPPQSPP